MIFLVEIVADVLTRLAQVAGVIQQIVGELKCDPEVHAIVMQRIGNGFPCVAPRRSNRCKQRAVLANDFLILLGACGVAGMHQLHHSPAATVLWFLPCERARVGWPVPALAKGRV